MIRNSTFFVFYKCTKFQNPLPKHPNGVPENIIVEWSNLEIVMRHVNSEQCVRLFTIIFLHRLNSNIEK